MIREINYDYTTLGISANQTVNSIKMVMSVLLETHHYE